LLEYGIILVLVAIVIVAVLILLGTSLSSLIAIALDPL
jgi:Flp pilus assembly pilin Flp